MPSIEGNYQEEKNKTRSYIDEVFNKHNLSSIERYFGGNSIEDSRQAGMSGEGFKQFLTDFFNAFHDCSAKIEHLVRE